MLDDAARLRAGALVGLAVAAANGINVLFHFVVARLLVPAEYSLLATLFVIITVLAIPTLSLQAAVARQVVARLGREGEAGAGLVLREAFAVLLRKVPVLLLIGIAVAVPAALLTHVQRPLPAIATVVAVVAALPASVVWGGLQGTERFRTFGASQLGYGLTKLVAGVVFAAAGFGVAAIVFGVAAASVIAAGASLWPLRRALAASRGRSVAHLNLASQYVTWAAVALSVFAALTAIDVVVARMAFGGTTAGAYAAASIGARALLVAPMAATTVLFPRIASLHSRAGGRRYLLGGIAAVGVLGAVGSAVVLAFPAPLLHLAFGHRYDASEPWIGLLCVAMALYGVANVYLFQFLAQGRLRYVLVLGAAMVLQLAGYALFHARPIELIYVQLGVAGGLVLASEAFDRFGRRRR